jgi:hypothetical protein
VHGDDDFELDVEAIVQKDFEKKSSRYWAGTGATNSNPTSSAKSEITKLIRVCGGELCPYLRASVIVPQAWQEGEALSLR